MPSSNKSVGSASSNPKKQKKASRKKDKKEKQQQQKEPAQPKAKAKASSSSPIRSRRAHHSRRASLPPKVEAARNLVLMLVVVVLGLGLGLLCALVGYRAMHGRGSGSNRLRTFTMKRRLLPVSRLVHNVEVRASMDGKMLSPTLSQTPLAHTHTPQHTHTHTTAHRLPCSRVAPAVGRGLGHAFKTTGTYTGIRHYQMCIAFSSAHRPLLPTHTNIYRPCRKCASTTCPSKTSSRPVPQIRSCHAMPSTTPPSPNEISTKPRSNKCSPWS